MPQADATRRANRPLSVLSYRSGRKLFDFDFVSPPGLLCFECCDHSPEANMCNKLEYCDVPARKQWHTSVLTLSMIASDNMQSTNSCYWPQVVPYLCTEVRSVLLTLNSTSTYITESTEQYNITGRSCKAAGTNAFLLVSWQSLPSQECCSLYKMTSALLNMKS